LLGLAVGQVLVGGASAVTLDRIRQDKAIRIAYRDDDRRLLRCSSALTNAFTTFGGGLDYGYKRDMLLDKISRRFEISYTTAEKSCLQRGVARKF
jgi:hypothetical protein